MAGMKIEDYHNHMTLFVCLACQRSCSQCSQRGLMQWKPDYQMSLGEVEKFISDTKESDYDKFKSIIISGGEPLLWRHLEEGVRMLRESGLSHQLNIFTNGINAEAVTTGLFDNITILRLSKYAENKPVLADLVDRFGSEHIKIVDQTMHYPIPTELLDNVLPAKCGCEGYGLCDGIMYACPMVPAVAKEFNLELADFPESYCDLQPHWAEILNDFDKANHLFCRGCIGNQKVRGRMARTM